MNAMKLLQGSRNIDKMRGEVDQFVRMIIGFALRSNYLPGLRKKFSNDVCTWVVSPGLSSGDRAKRTIEIECHNRRHYGELVGYSTTSVHLNNTGEIQQVYENLDILIAGVIEMFPDIEALWKPLIDASTPLQTSITA